MYLIIAESNARLGRDLPVKQAIFKLASNRNSNYVLSTNTGAALIIEILNNRRVDFWAEGFRWYDLKRLNLPLDRTVVPNYVCASAGGVLQIPAVSNLWQFVVPIAEIQANPKKSQNP